MKSRLGKDTDDAEWQRVIQNPDNMIVSDSLRDQVANILSNRTESSDYFAELLVKGRPLTLELTRLDRGKDKTVISGICDKLALKPFLALDLQEWTQAKILCGEESVMEVSLSGQQLEVSHEISSAAGVCFVTLTCMSPPQKSTKRVL